jgi:hypothetical protein
MCEFLLEAPECEGLFTSMVHAVDDFYKKPIDHLTNNKGVVAKAKVQLAD